MGSRISLQLLVLGIGPETQKELGFRPAGKQEVDLQQRPKRTNQAKSQRGMCWRLRSPVGRAHPTSCSYSFLLAP